MVDYIKLNEENGKEESSNSKLEFSETYGLLIISNRIFSVEIFRYGGRIVIYDYRDTPFCTVNKISFDLLSSFEDNLKLFLDNIDNYEDNSTFKFEEAVKRFLKINAFT